MMPRRDIATVSVLAAMLCLALLTGHLECLEAATDHIEIDHGDQALKIRVVKTKAPASPRGAAGASLPAIPLFGTMEFRASLDALPNWLRVLAVAERQLQEMTSCDVTGGGCSPSSLSWQQLMRQARDEEPLAQMRLVSTFFNRWPYRLDHDVHGVSDFWASPQEFMKLSGDCEDYSIAKYFALQQLGFDPANLRIVVVMDTIRNLPHSVLAVYHQNEAYVLDNMSDLVLPHDRYSHYVPQYSANEFHRWMHIRTEMTGPGDSTRHP